jgi:3-hydroxyisobutyryl-CoA hydrolase
VACCTSKYEKYNTVSLLLIYLSIKYQHDFKEGVGAFFEKRAAQWQPSKLADVNLEQHIRKNLFGFQHEMRRLCLSSKDYVESPFERFGLPTTEQVRAIEEKYHMKSMSEVESWFLAEHQGKFGIRQRVQQALNQGQYQKR